mmetsp:Transcript_71921/g.227291  ORF Transcript_71921/g.227291 Transcript_71921/m.227291 type:complete len:93 (+) Transcript_71921:887-1165(+)
MDGAAAGGRLPIRRTCHQPPRSEVRLSPAGAGARAGRERAARRNSIGIKAASFLTLLRLMLPPNVFATGLGDRGQEPSAMSSQGGQGKGEVE